MRFFRWVGCCSLYLLIGSIIVGIVSAVVRSFGLAEEYKTVAYLFLILAFYYLSRYGKTLKAAKIEKQQKTKQDRLACFSVDNFTDENYYPLTPLHTVQIMAKFKGRARREVFTVHGILSDTKGFPVFNLKDEFGRTFYGHYLDLTSLITYKNDTYRTFDDFLAACAYKNEIKAYKQARSDFLEFIAKLKQEAQKSGR